MKKINDERLKVYNDIYYCLSEDNKSVILLGCQHKMESIVLPAEIEGMPVVAIDQAYVAGRRIDWTAKEVTIPQGVVISCQAFAFSPIEKVTLQSGVILQERAFEQCHKLTTVNMEPGVRFEQRPALWVSKREPGYGHMFFDFGGVSNELTAPKAWIECFEQKMTIQDLLKEGFSFQAMYNRNVFGGCESLTEIVIPEGIEYLPDFTFWQCISLCKITLPSSLKAIGAECFCACKNLTNIVLPEGVVLIGELAFNACDRLETVVLPDTLTHISGNPFAKCKSLKRIVVPSGMKGVNGLAELDERIYPYASLWNVEMSDFNKEEFFSAKSWKQVLKSKASKITNEIPSTEELEEQCRQAMQFVLGQGEFDKQKEFAAEITDYLIESRTDSASYKRKDISALKKQIISYVDAMQTISKNDSGNQEGIFSAVKTLVEYINDFDRRFMAIETEERESICMLIEVCADLAGFKIPDNDSYFDITESWREW